MTTFEARVSFYDTREPASDAVVSVSDEELAIEVAGQPIGRWPIDKLSPAVVDEAVVITVEGERLLIEVANLRTLLATLRLPPSRTKWVFPLSAGREGVPFGPGSNGAPDSRNKGRHVAHRSSAETNETPSPDSLSVSIDLLAYESSPAEPQEPALVASLRSELREMEAALAIAQTQLRWVTDLIPRRLPIMTHADETGLGAVQGVQLKERRSPPRPDGTQPWMVVDSGNVYVTDRRLLFSGDREIDFYFDDIERKGASRTGLLLGVASRDPAHILAGPGERLAVVLTAAEKIAKGLEPTEPFRDLIGQLTADIESASTRLESLTEVPTVPDQAHPLPANTA